MVSDRDLLINESLAIAIMTEWLASEEPGSDPDSVAHAMVHNAATYGSPGGHIRCVWGFITLLGRFLVLVERLTGVPPKESVRMMAVIVNKKS